MRCAPPHDVVCINMLARPLEVTRTTEYLRRVQGANMRRVFLSIAVIALVLVTHRTAVSVAAQNPLMPPSAYEPPAAKDAASLTASTKVSPASLLTTSEKTNWAETGTYSEVI